MCDMQKTPGSVFVTKAFFLLKRGPQKDSYDESMGSDGKATNHKAVALVIEHSIKLKYLMPKSVLLCQFLKLSHSPVSAIREQF